jgi:N-methylhydantoinase A
MLLPIMLEPQHPIVGVDVGGTFTDFVYLEAGQLRTYKLLSTRADPSVALLAGLDALGVAAAAVIAHGTTVATNAVLEHAGARVALIATAGFRDLLAIGRQTRPNLYRLAFPPRWLPAPDELRFEVTERVAATGAVVTPLDEGEAAAVLDWIIAAGAEALAVCLLFSFANSAHEQAIKRLAEARGLPVSLSSEILPEFREFERTATTVLNAYVSPLMARYLDALEMGLARRQIANSKWQIGKSANGKLQMADHRSTDCNLQFAICNPPSAFRIMQSSGGILDAATARREAVRTLLSGPAGGVTGAFHVAGLAGHARIITFDMGGTSTDVSLADGQIRRTSEGRIEGWPVRVPMIDIHTVGAGGGSIAWADAGGVLRVGPGSAGSEPGPACYGRGGREFTVTDANLLLGRLAADHFLGGRMALDISAAERAAAPLAAALGLTPAALAEGVIRVANAHMEQAIRVISVERGFDPRDFTLVPFGGAGPMHALDLAAALHIGRVLIPRAPGVLSALGLALADFTVDRSRTLMWPLGETSAAALAQAVAPLLADASAAVAAAGFGDDAIRLAWALDLRYCGQSFELTVPVETDDPAEAGRRFHAAHEQRYGYARPDAAVELVNVRVTATSIRPKPAFPQPAPAPSPDPRPAQIGETRLAAGDGWRTAAVYERALLLPGHELAGPALVVQEDATTVIPPGWRATVDAWLNLVCAWQDIAAVTLSGQTAQLC